MKVKLVIDNLQAAFLIPANRRAPRIGPLTRACFENVSQLDPEADYFGPEEAKAEDISALQHVGGEGARDISEKGADFIRSFEGLWLTGALDSGGVPTIGWGHTGLVHNDGTVFVGRKITVEKAKQLFRYDMEQFEAQVSARATVPLNDDQYAALVSWAFNTGGPKSATLWKKLNAGDYPGAAQELLKWDKDNGQQVAGLTRRRRSERRLFLGKEHYLLADRGEVQKDIDGRLG